MPRWPELDLLPGLHLSFERLLAEKEDSRPTWKGTQLTVERLVPLTKLCRYFFPGFGFSICSMGGLDFCYAVNACETLIIEGWELQVCLVFLGDPHFVFILLQEFSRLRESFHHLRKGPTNPWSHLIVRQEIWQDSLNSKWWAHHSTSTSVLQPALLSWWRVPLPAV